MSRATRLSLIVVALLLIVAGFMLRATSADSDAPWWQVALSGFGAGMLVYLFTYRVRSRKKGKR